MSESRDVPPDSVAEWHKILPGIMSDADEAGHFYHLMPNMTLAYKSKKCKGEKKK